MDFLFPIKSNSAKGVSITDFKPELKKEKKSFDLTFKDGKFTLNKRFLEGRDENTGFVPVIPNGSSTPYLLKSLTADAFEKTIFVRGESAINTFNSDALEFIITQGGLTSDTIYLHNTDISKEGFVVYELSNTPYTAAQTASSFEAVKETTEGEIGQFANPGVEEQVSELENFIG